MKLELLETFLTGHPVIDAEHQRIVQRINEIHDVILDEDYEKCSTLLDGFLKVCTDHFAVEEKLLAELGYPHLEEHIIFHRELTLKAKAIMILCIDMSAPEKIRRCFDEMATLLIDDVIKGDMRFVSFLIDKGVVEARNRVHPIEKRTHKTK